jgi:tetratricopeptide (TPR) repeat protein
MGAFHARIGALVLDAEPLAHRAKAQEILEEALRRNPYSSAANFYLGLATNFDATLPHAIELFKRSIELNPSFPSAHAHVGHALVRTGHPAEGLPYIKYAMRLSPRDPTMTVFLEMTTMPSSSSPRCGSDRNFGVRMRRSRGIRAPGRACHPHALAERMEARGYARKLMALQPRLGPDARSNSAAPKARACTPACASRSRPNPRQRQTAGRHRPCRNGMAWRPRAAR